MFHESASLDGTAHDLNICGWPATFTTTGQTQLVIVESGEHLHWRGRNEETVVGNFDLAGPRDVFHAVQLFSEGPFHGLSVHETFVVDANGIVRIERQVSDEEVDCA